MMIINERFAEAVINNKSRDLWAEVKRIRGCGACPINVVDGPDTPAEISSFFAKKYQDLYTSVSYDSNCMNDIFCELDELLAVAGYNENCIITSCNVLDAICKLNPARATVMVV